MLGVYSHIKVTFCINCYLKCCYWKEPLNSALCPVSLGHEIVNLSSLSRLLRSLIFQSLIISFEFFCITSLYFRLKFIHITSLYFRFQFLSWLYYFSLFGFLLLSCFFSLYICLSLRSKFVLFFEPYLFYILKPYMC